MNKKPEENTIKMIEELEKGNKNEVDKSSTEKKDESIEECFMGEIKDKVKGIILKHTREDKKEQWVSDSSAKLSCYGIDSLDAIEIIMDVEEEFGIEIPDGDAQQMEIMDDIVKYVMQKKS